MAVLLCYIDWRKEQRKRLEAEVQKDAEHRELAELLRTLGVKKGTAGISSEPKIVKRVIEPPKSPKTSPGFSELLSHYAMRDQTVFLPKAKAGQVKLEGHLHRKSSKTLETEFKIGIGRMYVLKSISKMVAAVQNMETVSYGAQLSFLHCMDAFQEESRPMVSFLTSYAEETNACFQMASGLYGSYLDDRYLTLTVQNLDEFFLALGEQGFYYDTYLTEEDCWHCRREMPRYEMELLRKADGLEVRMQMDAIMSGRKYLYLVSGQNVNYQVQKEQIEEVRDFMEYIAQRQDGTCVIAKEDIPTFCQGLLPVLEEHFDVKKRKH